MIRLEPTIGTEINKIRPCIIISPDVVNKYKNNVVIVPLTSKLNDSPSRINCKFQNKNGQAVIDQIRTVDKIRLIKKLGNIDLETSKNIYEMIKIYFK